MEWLDTIEAAKLLDVPWAQAFFLTDAGGGPIATKRLYANGSGILVRRADCLAYLRGTLRPKVKGEVSQ